MPLLHTFQPAPHTILGVWQIDEPVPELYDALPAHVDTSPVAGKVHPRREQEWLASRVLAYQLLRHFTDEPLPLHRDDNGKPSFGNSKINLSITHAPALAAVILSDAHDVGIDIEQISQKALRVANKFLTETEKRHTADDEKTTCLYWSAKETLYKMYSKRKLILKENISLAPSEAENKLLGQIRTENFSKDYQVYFERLHDHILTYAIDNNTV